MNRSRIRILTLLILALALAMTSCTSKVDKSGRDVSPLFPKNGANWNDYVQGNSVPTATDTACISETDTDCIHGGEYLYVTVTGTSSCAGLTAYDSLGAMDWRCDASTDPVRMISTGLRDGTRLSDLVDFWEEEFKQNYVTVSDPTGTIVTTSEERWWDNGVENIVGCNFRMRPGRLYLVTSDLQYPITINAERTALLIKPNITLRGSAAINEWVVRAENMDFLWIEGSVDATGDEAAFYVSNSSFSTLANITASGGEHNIALYDFDSGKIRDSLSSGATGDGIALRHSSGNMISDINSGSNTIGISLDLDSTNNKLDAIDVQDNRDSGIYLYSSSDSNVLTDITAQNNSIGIMVEGAAQNMIANVVLNYNGHGLYVTNDNTFFTDPNNTTIQNVTGTNNDFGILILNADDIVVDRIRIIDSIKVGFSIYALYNSTMSNIEIYNTSMWHGFAASRVWDSHITNITTSGNGYNGVNMDFISGNYISNIVTANNREKGYSSYNISKNTITNIFSSNNVKDGINLSLSSNNSLSGLTATSNSKGIKIYSSTGNTLSDITTANNSSFALQLQPASGNTISRASVINSYYGIVLIKAEYNLLADMATYGHTRDGINMLSASYNTLTGLLMAGYNTRADCFVFSSGSILPGVIHASCTTTGLNGSSDYGTNLSDAVLWRGLDLSSSFTGKVISDDTVNPDDINGVQAYDNITGWVNFETPYRGWGIYNGNPMPDIYNQGDCLIGQDCQLWDWTLSASDTILLNSLTLPNGNETIAHTWDISPAPIAQADCDAAHQGSIFVIDHCESVFLSHAREISDDAIGNDDTLCESGEVCLYTPNIASYQGHGNLISAGPFTDGTLNSITLLKYESNGY